MEIENRCGEIKATLQKLTDVKCSPTARLVAVLATCGITDTAEVASLIGRSVRMVQIARNELRETHCVDAKPIAQNATNFAKPIAENETHCAPRVHARAQMELPSEVLPTKIVKDIPPLPPKGPTKVECLEAFHDYNETAQRCGLPQARSMTKERETKIRARLKEVGIEGWRQALANIEKSSYLTGSNKDGWLADLKFLLRPDNFHKVLDGGYGNGRHAKAAVSIRMAKSESQKAAENEAMLREYGLHPELNG
jgi:hypothetical protein